MSTERHHEHKHHSPPSVSAASTPTSAKSKLRKIPPIRRTDDDDNYEEECNANDDNYDGSVPDHDQKPREPARILHASVLGLNHIKTRSSSSSSSTTFRPSNLGMDVNVDIKNCGGDGDHSTRIKWPGSAQSTKINVDQVVSGKKAHWGQSNSLKNPFIQTLALEANHAAFAKEIQSPRFQAILRLTSGRKKRTPDIKSFSHELNSKGVRPFPLWKPRAFGHMEEIMVAVRAKFDKLKEEVNADLGVFAGDLVGILEKISESHPEWKESLEDLLIIARMCAKMSAKEFWLKCEGIVQNLDDRRQELPTGILKQAHTRLLFILTRCSRLVQFQKETGYEEDHFFAYHQFSDLGVYPEQIVEIAQQDFSRPLSKEEYEKVAKKSHSLQKDMYAKQIKKSHGHINDSVNLKEDQLDQNLSTGVDVLDEGTAKSADSSASSYRMSSWKRLPSAAERNRKGPDSVDTPMKERLEKLQGKYDTKAGVDAGTDNLDTPLCHMEHSDTSSRTQRHWWGSWGDSHQLTCENLMICRICEVEIPTVHVEEHSRICTITDRCDLKGLSVNERLERVAETLERILESLSAKSTPKGIDTPGGNPRQIRSMPNEHEDLDDIPLSKSSLRHECSEDIFNNFPEAGTALVMDDLNILPDISCGTRSASELGTKASSPESTTPRSPLLTPRTSQIELLLSERKTISELENYDQIGKLLDITRSVANINNFDYGALECMLDRLEELKYSIQDRKVDGLVVETFGRRIEKLLQEKYVMLCTQIEDEKDSSNHTVDEESSEEDTIRSLRASPINPCSKDRTSIEDFEIMKPISRGAFGRVFLARKRATGDLFAIKVLRKADMIRKNAVESILAERDILISARNPFMVRFFYSFTCRDNLYLVMEYLNGGDLYSLLRNLGCLDEDMVRIYIAEVVLALEYLHSLNVIHRDLKPDNLLIGQDGHIKLTDFGLSKVGLINSTDDLSGPSVSGSGFFGDEKPKAETSVKIERRQKHSVVGTPDYLAPEILLGMGHGKTADWWSVGVILYELLVGIPPFNADHPQQIFDNIMNRDIPWPKVPEEMSSEAYDLIDKLLTENPVQRLGATGAGEVKRHSFFKDINWDTLARQKAMFIPSAEPLDTSYFMSRYIWNPEDENAGDGSDFDDLTETASCSSSSMSNINDEDRDECGSLADFSAPNHAVTYSFSNFSFKNLSQLASINYDLVAVRSNQDSGEASKPMEQ